MVELIWDGSMTLTPLAFADCLGAAAVQQAFDAQDMSTDSARSKDLP